MFRTQKFDACWVNPSPDVCFCVTEFVSCSWWFLSWTVMTIVRFVWRGVFWWDSSVSLAYWEFFPCSWSWEYLIFTRSSELGIRGPNSTYLLRGYMVLDKHSVSLALVFIICKNRHEKTMEILWLPTLSLPRAQVQFLIMERKSHKTQCGQKKNKTMEFPSWKTLWRSFNPRATNLNTFRAQEETVNMRNGHIKTTGSGRSCSKLLQAELISKNIRTHVLAKWQAQAQFDLQISSVQTLP